MFSANKRFRWDLQVQASLRHSSVVVTSVPTPPHGEGLQIRPDVLQHHEERNPPLLLPITTPSLSFIYLFIFSQPQHRKMAGPHGKGYMCWQEGHLLWEEEGPDINRKSCAAGRLPRPSERGLENNVGPRFRARRQEMNARWCLQCRGNDKHYLV